MKQSQLIKEIQAIIKSIQADLENTINSADSINEKLRQLNITMANASDDDD